jgi:hypothetical protein
MPSLEITGAITMLSNAPRLLSSKGVQRDPRSHESFDKEACSRLKIPAFRGGQHNILAAFIQRDPDFASTARNPSTIFQIHPFRPPF